MTAEVEGDDEHRAPHGQHAQQRAALVQSTPSSRSATLNGARRARNERITVAGSDE